MSSIRTGRGSNASSTRFSRIKKSLMLSAAVASALTLGRAAVADFHWDPDGVGGIPANGGSGSWNGASAWFNESTTTYGTWPLSGADAVARFTGTGGTVTINSPVEANALIFDNGGYTISGPAGLTLVAGGASVFPVPALSVTNAADVATINAPLSGSLGLFKGGAGTLILSGNGNSALTGTIVVSEGVLGFSADHDLGASSNAVDLSSGTLRYIPAGSLNLTRNINGLGGSLDIADAAGQLSTDGIISGNLTKLGAGALLIKSSNNHSVSSINVENGRLIVQDFAALPSLGSLGLGSTSVPTAGTLDYTGTAANTVLGTSINLGSAGGVINVADAAATLDVNGQIIGGVPSLGAPQTVVGLTKSGPGTLTLSATNNYVGNLLVTGGVVSIAADTALGEGYNGVTLDGGVLRLTGTNIDPGAGGTAANSKFRVFRIGDNGGTFDVQLTGTFLVNDGPAFQTLNQFASVNPNTATGSADVFTKTGTGTLELGNASDSYANTFTGTSVIKNGLVRLGNAGGLGKFQITVTNDPTAPTPGAGVLGLAATGVAVNPIVIENGGTIGSIGGDRNFGGPITLNDNWAFNPTDLVTATVSRDTTLSGPLTLNNNDITIGAFLGASPKGLTLANTTTTPNNLGTGKIIVPAGAILSVGGAGTGAGSKTGLTSAEVAGNVQLLDGGTFGLRSNEATTFGNFPSFAGLTNFGLHADRLGGTSTGVTLHAGPLALANQTVTVTGNNGYRLAPSTLSLPNNPTLRLNGGILVPTVITNGGAGGNTVTIEGNNAGMLIVNNEAGGPHSLAGTTFDLKASRLVVQGGTAGTDPLGGADVTFNGGALGLTSSAGGAVFDRAIAVTTPLGRVQHLGHQTDTYGAGANGFVITSGSTLSLEALGGRLNVATPINGAGNLNISGTGTVDLQGNNSTHTGVVNANGGRVILSNASGRSIGGALGVNGSTIDLSGTTQTMGPATLTNGSVSNGTFSPTSITKSGPVGSAASVDARVATGGVSVTGGTLRVTNTAAGAGANSITGPVSASSGGILQVHRSATGSDPISGQAVDLNGGTLRLTGTNAVGQGLLGEYFQFGAAQEVRLGNTSDMFNVTTGALGGPSHVSSTISSAKPNLDLSGITVNGNPFSDTNNFADQGFNGTVNFLARYSGKINIAQTGPILFATTSDDGTNIYIDGQLVSFNNFGQGATERTGWVDLTAGEHDIVIEYSQGGGGKGWQAHMTPLGGTRTLISNSILSNNRALDVDTDINVTGTSTLTIVDAVSAKVGDINLGGTLRVNGTVLADSTTLTANGGVDVALGSSLSTPGIGGGAFTLTKSGTGVMAITGASTHTGGANVNGGTLRVSHNGGLGSGPVAVNDFGTLEVAAANTNLSNVTVAGDGRLLLTADQAVAGGAAVPTAPINGIYEIRGTTIGNDFDGVQLAGGATWQFSPDRADRQYNSDITLNGPVTLNSISNTITVNGTVSGAGGITTTGGTIQFDAPVTVTGSIIQEGGITRFRNGNHARNIAALNIFGGEFNANDNPNSTTTDRFNNNLPVNLYNGSLTSFMRNDGTTHIENMGVLNILGGARVFAQAGTGNSQSGYQFDSLNRTFGTRVSFEGTNLGGTAASRGNILFDTAPTLTNGIIGGWAVANNAEFATYGANGVAPITTTAVAETALTTPATNQKLALGAAVTLTGPRTANSLVINGTGAQTLNFNGNSLTLTSGGLLVTGNATEIIGAGVTGTAFSNDPGTITSSGPELFLSWRSSADNVFLDVNTKVTGTNAVVVNSSGNAGNLVRFRNTANDFTGGLYLMGGALESRSVTDTGNALSTGPITLGGGQLQIRDTGSGSNQQLSYGNNVTVVANSTINVDRPAGANTGNTIVFGNLTIRDGRTLTLTGANGYRADFANLVLTGDGTYNNASANTTIQGNVTVPAGKTFTKAGGSFMTIPTDNAATFLGGTRVTGGNLQIGNMNALGLADATNAPRIDVDGGSLAVSVANYNLSNTRFAPGTIFRNRAQQDNAAFRPASIIYGLDMSGDANFADSPGLGADYDLTFAPGANIRFVDGTFTAAVLAGDIIGQGDITINQTGGATKTVDINGVISGPGVLTKTQSSGTMNVNLNAANTYTGGTRLGFGAAGGILNATVTGALSTGPVDVTSGFLELRATAAADNNVSILNGQILYAANEAAGGNVLTARGTQLNQAVATPTAPAVGAQVGQIHLDTVVTSVGADTFNIAAGNAIRGGSAQLALLNRNASGTGAANVTLAPGAIVAHTTVDTSAPTIQDLGTAADLWFGLGANFGGQNLTIGAGTPWRGISTDWNTADTVRSWTTGVITIAPGTTSIDLANNRTNATGNHAMRVGVGTNAATLAIVKPGGPAVPANIYGRIILDGGAAAGPLSDYSGISQFVVQDGGVLQLDEAFALGGGNGSTPVPVLVKNGGWIDPGPVGSTAGLGATMNANVTIESGGLIQINDVQNFANSSGVVTPQAGSIALLQGASNDILANNDLSGPAASLANYATTPGVIVRLERNNTNWLNETFSDASIFQLINANRTTVAASGTSGLSISGGGLTNDAATRQLDAGTGVAVNIGANGATFSATTNTNLNIAADVLGNGDIIAGAEPIAGLNKLGQVRLIGANNVFRNLTVDRGFVELSDGATDQFDISGTMRVKDGALLRLNGNQQGLGDELRAATNGGRISVDKGGWLDLKVRTAAAATPDIYNTPIVFGGTGSGTGMTNFTFDEDGGAGVAVLNNVTFNEGADVRITVNDMGRNEARINGKLAGNATIRGFNADFSFTDLRNTSAAPVTFVMGSANENASRSVEILGALGNAADQPLTIDQVKMTMVFAQGSSMAPNVTINNLGSSHALPLPAISDPSIPFTSPTSATLVDGFVTVNAGQAGTGGITAGTINLGGGKIINGIGTAPQDVRIIVNEVASGAQVVNTLGATVNVVPDAIGWINADRGTDSTVNGRGRFAQVNLANNSQVYLEARTDQEVEVANLGVTGNGTVQNISHNSKVLVGNVTGAPASKVTFDGTNITRLIGNVSGVNEVVVRNRGIEAEGGAGTINVNAPVKVYTSFGATTGTVDLGSNPITGASGTVAGLREGVIYNATAVNTTTANPGTNVRLGPVMGNSATVGWTDPANPAANRTDNQTYVYTGEVFFKNRGDGIGELAFAESVDDQTVIVIDGTTVLDQRSFNVNGATGKIEKPVTGDGTWYPIEIRLWNGGGGAGAANQQGWAALGGFFPFGLGVDRTGAAAAETALPVQANYEIATDNGSMDLFRTTVNSAGTVGVNPGATLKAGNVSSIARFNVNGTANVANVDATATVVGNGTAAANLTANYVRGSSLAINATSKVTMNPSTEQPAGPNTSDVNALTIAGATDAWTGTLDLTNNDMVVRTAGGTARDTAYANALNQAKSGLAEASGVFWSGTGITSSTAASTGGGLLTAVGIIINDFAAAGLPPGPIYNEFSTRTVTENDILMKYTWFGDADLSGVVDGTDYFLIDQAFAAGTLNGGWLNGDFSYDGKVDGTDYFLIDQTFNAQTGPLGGGAIALDAVGGGAVASAVPEPGVAGLLAVASLGLLGRRRRRA